VGDQIQKEITNLSLRGLGFDTGETLRLRFHSAQRETRRIYSTALAMTE